MPVLGGSFVSSKIEDYYTSPYELGYGPFIKFDHDFIGTRSLEGDGRQEQRKKVTFAWDDDDVNRINASMFAPAGENYKFIDLPLSNYASSSFDCGDERRQERRRFDVLGLQLQRAQDAFAGLRGGRISPSPAPQLTLVWGEENGGTKKTTVERHKQTEVKVIVSPVPYSAVVREGYEGKWRHQAAE